MQCLHPSITIRIATSLSAQGLANISLHRPLTGYVSRNWCTTSNSPSLDALIACRLHQQKLMEDQTYRSRHPLQAAAVDFVAADSGAGLTCPTMPCKTAVIISAIMTRLNISSRSWVMLQAGRVIMPAVHNTNQDVITPWTNADSASRHSSDV